MHGLEEEQHIVHMEGEIEGENESNINEEEEGGGEDDEVEEDDEEEEYAFMFKSGMNPLGFTDNDALGLQTYQQFERLEYEALAVRKRKAIALTPSEEDVAKYSMYEMVEAMVYGGFRRKSRKLNKQRGRRKGTKNKPSPEISRMLGEATLHYVYGCFEQAIPVLTEVVRLAPNVLDPYHTLGIVHKALGNDKIVVTITKRMTLNY